MGSVFSIRVSSHLRITENPLGSPKTKIFTVMSSSGDYLGTIKWFGRWRKYCFFPGRDTIFDDKCLAEITTYCIDATLQHKEKKKEIKSR